MMTCRRSSFLVTEGKDTGRGISHTPCTCQGVVTIESLGIRRVKNGPTTMLTMLQSVITAQLALLRNAYLVFASNVCDG